MAGRMIYSIYGLLVLLYGYWSLSCRGGMFIDLLYLHFETPLLFFYLQILPIFKSDISSTTRSGHLSTHSLQFIPSTFENRVFAQHCILLSLPFYLQVLGLIVTRPTNTFLFYVIHLLAVPYYRFNAKWRKPPDKLLE